MFYQKGHCFLVTKPCKSSYKFTYNFSMCFFYNFSGGLKEFVQKHQNLCEPMCREPEFENLVGATIKLPTTGPSEECTSNVPGGPPVSEIISRLFIGNKISASDESLIDSLGIKYILNVTKDHPNYFHHRPDLAYKQVSVNDSCKEDIGIHFEDALQFIGKNLDT